MTQLRGKRVLLGVGGGIAAYKAPQLVRDLKRAGATVRVVVTRSAREFVSPMALQVVSEHRVGSELLDPAFEHEIGHIELARWADVVAIAPATANLISRMRVGAADDLLTTIVLATEAPVVVFPSMNTQMWRHPAVQENIQVLEARGVVVGDPDAGELACKEVGAGRQPDPDAIIAVLERTIGPGTLVGRSVLVSAGPTRESFDPVRFVSNGSSGKMGFAVAAAARAAGANVTLVAGPTALDTPTGCVRVNVVSAAEMRAAVVGRAADVLVMAAAVGDWTPTVCAEEKLKKAPGTWSPTLRRTADILREVAAEETRPTLVVGFAAETSNVEAYARQKLSEKSLDGIVANDVSGGRGFGTDENTVLLIAGDAPAVNVGPADKREVADAIVAWCAGLLEAKS